MAPSWPCAILVIWRDGAHGHGGAWLTGWSVWTHISKSLAQISGTKMRGRRGGRGYGQEREHTHERTQTTPDHRTSYQFTSLTESSSMHQPRISRAHGVVVSHPLRMRAALSSIPSGSISGTPIEKYMPRCHSGALVASRHIGVVCREGDMNMITQ